MKRFLPALIALSLTLTACGTSSPGEPTAVPTIRELLTYHDSVQNFSFQYPYAWKVQNPTGDSPYIVPIKVTSYQAHIEVLVGKALQPAGSKPIGKRRNPIRRNFQLFGHSAAEIQQIDARRLPTAIDTIVTANGEQYDIRLTTSVPPLETRIIYGYHQIVQSFKVS